MFPSEVLRTFPSTDISPLAPLQNAVRVLRLSVTDRCNFRCRYCMPERGVDWVPHSQLLSLEQLAEEVRWLCQLTSIDRIKLTGGEPLVRRGLTDLIRALCNIPQVREVSLTTNGSMLAEHASALKEAGLSRVNISLDSLDEQRFTALSRSGKLQNTLKGIEAALRAGLTPLKLNAVLLLSSWQQDVPALLDYAASLGVELRFIELMRTGTEHSWCASEVVMVDEVQAWLAKQAEVKHVADNSASPARRTVVHWNGRQVIVGWITPRSQPFCSSCERLRLDSQGRLRRCLMDPAVLNLRALRTEMDNSEAERKFRAYLNGKQAPECMDTANAMISIGG